MRMPFDLWTRKTELDQTEDEETRNKSERKDKDTKELIVYRWTIPIITF